MLTGCGGGLPGGILLPILDGRGVGSCLGRVNSLYNVSGGLAFRLTHRAFTAAVALTGKMPVRAIDGVLNRAGVRAARVCTHVAGDGVDGSVRSLTKGLNGMRDICGGTRWLGRCVYPPGRGRCKGEVCWGREKEGQRARYQDRGDGQGHVSIRT